MASRERVACDQPGAFSGPGGITRRPVRGNPSNIQRAAYRMSTSQGRTLKLFLVDGVPNGLLTAEIMNWSGHCRHGDLVLNLGDRDEEIATRPSI